MNRNLQRSFREASTMLLLAVSILFLAATAAGAQTIQGVTLTQRITVSGNQVCATFRNTSNTDQQVGLATYLIDRTNFSLDAQVFQTAATATLAPGETRQLCLPVPTCAYQVDAFVGPVIQRFTGSYTYSGRILDGLLNGCFCVPTGEMPKGCVLTHGYYKNHADTWCVSSLTIGGTTYNKAQLLDALSAPTAGNCLISLARQLIAAKLNIACRGARAPQDVLSAIQRAEDLITGAGGLSGTLACGDNISRLIDALTNFNEGRAGVPSCDK